MKRSKLIDIPAGIRSKTQANERIALTRRHFLELHAAAAESQIAVTKGASAVPAKRDVYFVPKFHPASCEWLTAFSISPWVRWNSFLCLI